MRQLFQNLISNALKFSRSGVPPKIKISAHRANERWVFRVQDNGEGFDTGLLGKITKPFQRLHRRKEKEGTGIGLSVVDLIIKRLGGTLRAESTPGEGSVFEFDLPAAVES